ncbi:hypothetical protein J437_LFUL016561 [Ladona fulva]|uniref:Pre-mRNA splicing factor component Cdc5p/Cef1 C-terminal domain-containing protein n=1 Tax=Ladona fulva TaxID=123851 RepID=A0A8K0PCR5_LADFU|nr:hypothetical protein J437_LFUL016561 [Ladona fulva]
MALTHVDTPLKGGLNTTLHEMDFGGVTPQRDALTTPNTILATPFRSTRGADAETQKIVASAATPTPVRDKLNINPEEGLDIGDTPQAFRSYRKQLKEQLRQGLNALPAPRNDYEIVVPEEEEEGSVSLDQDNHLVHEEDQADVDARQAAEEQAQRKFLETSKKTICFRERKTKLITILRQIQINW